MEKENRQQAVEKGTKCLCETQVVIIESGAVHLSVNLQWVSTDCMDARGQFSQIEVITCRAVTRTTILRLCAVYGGVELSHYKIICC